MKTAELRLILTALVLLGLVALAAALPPAIAVDTASCIAHPPSLALQDDYEPNDSFEQATAINTDVEYTAYISPQGDDDWFQFYVVAGQEITVDLYGLYEDLPADFDLYLYGPAGSHLATSSASGTTPEQIVHTASQTGNYRARVMGWEGAYSDITPYRLRVTLSAVCEERIENGGFETGDFSQWQVLGSPWIASYLAHEGDYSGVVGGKNDADDTFYQEVFLPATVDSATLTYWWYIYTQEGLVSPKDYLFVEAQDTSGVTLETLEMLDNQSPTGGWQQSTIDLGDYPSLFGRTIRIAFNGTTDEYDFTSFYIDEVSLEVCGGPSPTPTRTTEPTSTWTTEPTATRTTELTPSFTPTPTPADTDTPTPTPALLPDLIVTDFWLEDGLICYQVMNIGSAEAPAGHLSALLVDDELIATQPIDEELLGGERVRDCFDYEWGCTPLEDSVVVVADYEGAVQEEDEENNLKEEIWPCDITSPEITLGPDVSEVTDHSALVSWETNEEASSVVFYGAEAGAYPYEQGDPTLGTVHQVTLADLQPATTYHLLARSVDPSGNMVESAVLRFETTPLPDTANPSVQLLDLGEWEGVVTLAAQAQDDGGVERVEFYIDGEVVFTDYSLPYEFPLDTTLFANGAHGISARAYDRAGRWGVADLGVDITNMVDLTSPKVTITAPGPSASVSGSISVTAQTSDDAGLDSILFYVDGQYRQVIGLSGKPLAENVAFGWDTTQVLDGSHTLGVEAHDLEGKTGLATVDVVVSNPTPLPQPQLWVKEHKVTRQGNSFTIELTVMNSGGGTATQVRIHDYLRGFQPIARTSTTPTSADYEVSYSPVDGLAECEIISHEDIAPGQTKTYAFDAVPILPYPGPLNQAVGDPMTLDYGGPGGARHSHATQGRAYLDADGDTIITAYSKALKQVDYLLVTNPKNLQARYRSKLDDVNDLLCDMAQLAAYRDGALVYLHTTVDAEARWVLQNYLTPGKNWAADLHPNFSKALGGYMLIVGETEIVPAFDVPHGNGTVWLCDQPYSDTVGSDSRPELIVSRIPGNSAARLDNVIETSLALYEGRPGYSFDRSDALSISGAGSMMDIFVWESNEVARVLGSQFAVETIHCRDHFQVADLGNLFSPGDELAIGDVLGTTQQEVLVARDVGGYVDIYDTGGNRQASLNLGFTAGDGFAVGDVLGAGNAEILIASDATGNVTVYDGSGTQKASFDGDFTPGDVLATANLRGDAKDEILVVGDVSGRADVFDGSGTKLGSFGTGYRAHGAVAVGDVISDTLDEIMIATPRSRYITVLDGTGTKLTSIKSEFSPDDGLAVGDVRGDAKADIMVANDVSGKIAVYFHEGPNTVVSSTYPLWVHFDSPYRGGDALVCGNVHGGTREEIVVASATGGDVAAYEPHSSTRIIPSVERMVSGKDVVFFMGHGGSKEWGHTLGMGSFPVSFGGSNPFVHGAACSTGYYGTNSRYSIGEAFLDSGAALYLGATTGSYPSHNRAVDKYLYENLATTSKSIGRLFGETERAIIDKSRYLLPARQYNLYGDPKLGAQPATSSLDDPTRADPQSPPPTTRRIDVPDYVVTHFGDRDLVEIPGGLTTQTRGEPELPIYAEQIEIPMGFQVQDVTLVARSEPQATTGLVIAEPSWITQAETALLEMGGMAPEPIWYPGQDFEWRTAANPEGTTTLSIVVYPFHYNPATTDARFYQEWDFAIDWVESSVAISELSTDKSVYDQTEAVSIDLAIENSGQDRDVVVEAVILRDDGSDALEDGLLLRTLHGLEGSASFAPVWESGDGVPGYYVVEVTLRDMAGTLLDRARSRFRLGIPAIEIETFSVTPGRLIIGEGVDIALGLRNIGTIPMTCTVVVQVTDHGGAPVQTCEHQAAGLLPQGTTLYEDHWDTTGISGGTYTVSAYALYDGMTTAMQTARVIADAGEKDLYLPYVTRWARWQ